MSGLYLGVSLDMPTRACLIDGEERARGRGYSMRNIVWDWGGAVKAVAESAAAAAAEAGASLSDVKMACVTVNYPDRDPELCWADSLTEEALPGIPYIIHGHTRAAHAAAFGHGDGIIVAVFDDSEALGVRGGQYARAGGWGDDFGGEGTMRRITYQAFRAAARYADGRGEKTDMLDHYCSLLDCWPRRLPYHIGDKHAPYAQLEEVVFRCAESGDLPAMRVLSDEAGELVGMVSAVAGRLEVPNPTVSVMGRCFRYPAFVAAFQRLLRGEIPDAVLKACKRTRTEGAAILAKLEVVNCTELAPPESREDC